MGKQKWVVAGGPFLNVDCVSFFLSAVNRNTSDVIPVLSVGGCLTETLASPCSSCFTFAMTWPWRCWASRWPPGTGLWRLCFGLWSGATTRGTSPSCRKCAHPFFLRVNDPHHRWRGAHSAWGERMGYWKTYCQLRQLVENLNSLTQAPKR